MCIAAKRWRKPKLSRPRKTPVYTGADEIQAETELTEVGICMRCGLIDGLQELARQLHRKTGHEPEACEFTVLPTLAALELAAIFDKRPYNTIPRCTECGKIPVEIYYISERRGRCRPCARAEWREIWAESVDKLVEKEASETPLETLLAFSHGP